MDSVMWRSLSAMSTRESLCVLGALAVCDGVIGAIGGEKNRI